MKLILLELNEINFNFVKKYLQEGEKLPALNKLIEGKFISTHSEDKYEYLEPWIQWVSVHTGKSFNDHKVFRLGDMSSSSEKQIFEILESRGFKVGAVSPMNTKNNLKNPSYFIPDPWTDTKNDGSLLSNFVHQSISQAVNDNSKGKLTFKTIIYFISSMLIAISFKDLLSLSAYAISCLRYRYKKALFLDLVIFKIHQYLFKKENPNFSALFLNGGAHIQHHYFFNSKFFQDSKVKNPNWYLSKELDPILDMLKCYDKIVSDLLDMKDVEVLVATGLSQIPYDRTKFYYRLKDHKKFLEELDITFRKVFPRMTRDFLVTFDSKQEAKIAEEKLSSLLVNNKISLFESIDNRGEELFITLTYPNEITKRDFIKIDGEKVFLNSKLIFVAIKNGMHQDEGYAYFSDGIKNFAPSDGDHVKEIHGSILKFFGVPNR
tara:strand:- start:1399 stop:2700 length:1302 start_codon:yes stop_codon:yes gene_type:complete